MSRNIIWILGDQHRGQALSCTGNTQLATPCIDGLAPAGQMAVAGSPLCTPFRSSLLTGMYPHKGAPGHDRALPDGMPTVADAFNARGYRTAWFGKWHVDGACNRDPGQRQAMQTVRPGRRGGFTNWLGYENNNAQYDCWVHGHDGSGNEVPHFRLEKYESDGLTDLFISYLEERGRERGGPFFAALSVQPPHCPYVADERWTRFSPEGIKLRPNVPPVPRVEEKSRVDLAGYYAMIENLDWNVGRVQAALEANGLADETVIIFFSDHGDMHGSHGQILKCSPYEESIRTPFMTGGAVTASDERRTSCPSIINHVDIPVTSLGIAGIDRPEGMEGTDWSGYFMKERALPADPPSSAYLQLVDPGFELGFAADRERPWRGVVTEDGWKYAVLEGQPWMMFDLNEDPYELANLALDRRFADKRSKLQQELINWIERTGDTFDLPQI